MVEDNNNPLFYEVLELDYEVFEQTDLRTYPPFIFDVYDYDEGLLIDSPPQFLGRCLVEAHDCARLEKHEDGSVVKHKSLILQSEFERCEDHG